MSEGKKLVVRSRRDDVAEPTVLLEGDTISYRVSHQVEFEDRTQAWVGMEVGSSVRHGESSIDAVDRVVGFVHDQLKVRILQLAQDAENITR